MIKGALQWIKDQAQSTLVTPCAGQYSTVPLTAVTEPVPTALKIHTLTGIVDYIDAHKEEGFDDLDGEEGAFLHVVSPREVHLRSGIFGPFHQRKTFLVAELPEARGYRFGEWFDAESFIIALQAHFAPDDTDAGPGMIKKLLAFVASIKEVSERTAGDDGISQTVTAKTGVTLVESAKVPNPVTLHPYRTFLEVEQPAISLVFRVRRGREPELSLHEADGGLWRLQAIKSIKDYLVKAVNTDLGQKIPVIA